MWLFSLDGMLSIVRHYDHKDMFLVRSRTPGVLERRFPEHPIIRLDDADYRYRVIVSYETVLAEMMSEMNDLLQRLGAFTFRSPTPAYKHSAAMFLKIRVMINHNMTHPDAPKRPHTDLEILESIASELRDVLEGCS